MKQEWLNLVDVHEDDGNDDDHPQDPTEDYLEAMMNEAPGPINFTMFLTLFGERLQGTDPEDVIKNAFRYEYLSWALHIPTAVSTRTMLV